MQEGIRINFSHRIFVITDHDILGYHAIRHFVVCLLIFDLVFLLFFYISWTSHRKQLLVGIYETHVQYLILAVTYQNMFLDTLREFILKYSSYTFLILRKLQLYEVRLDGVVCYRSMRAGILGLRLGVFSYGFFLASATAAGSIFVPSASLMIITSFC